ncbi:TIGR00297 family protein [Umezakia ovalisporum]|uniref:TIGR00297 family protein n=1 Tax=Umezakia ovalisporum FSS-43 TaxID=2740520 RepID=A0ABT6K9W2_9CYAN|nr:TIGR00297 family protein [Umezakia ovalisporum]MDH6058770.1 TIGR00297 family protein [Umezakia ovalisporum FSS-43]MDH6068888.1 TIGR00297 family protein [Umezakia ovalisporum APH033B]MDH6072062.1 TIGR00297 family protein [Umezakia ovalisporum CobakiLakeA]MDH6079591.1 TIGR00297 family protein [Umezakia ovalisporum FSS-45]MDH6082834.1 TIGR00297 family protein [Umezakia ovalisporum FSS-44]
MLFFIDFAKVWLVAIGLNTVLLGLVWIAPKQLLTPAGIFHAWLLGVLIWVTLGWQGYVVVGFYFLVGSGVTRIGMAQKEALGIAEKRSGARGPENVWGSALTGALCALGVGILNGGLLITTITTNQSLVSSLKLLLLLGYVASFSTKLADTTASEVGKAYGKRTFLITTLKPVPRGTEGAVSLEGTLAGVVAAMAMAWVGWAVGLMDLLGVLWCVLAAFIATNLESVIGATLQSKYDWLTNEVVNILNTLIGAVAAMVFALIWTVTISTKVL